MLVSARVCLGGAFQHLGLAPASHQQDCILVGQGIPMNLHVWLLRKGTAQPISLYFHPYYLRKNPKMLTQALARVIFNWTQPCGKVDMVQHVTEDILRYWGWGSNGTWFMLEHFWVWLDLQRKRIWIQIPSGWLMVRMDWNLMGPRLLFVVRMECRFLQFKFLRFPMFKWLYKRENDPEPAQVEIEEPAKKKKTFASRYRPNALRRVSSPMPSGLHLTSTSIRRFTAPPLWRMGSAKCAWGDLTIWMMNPCTVPRLSSAASCGANSQLRCLFWSSKVPRSQVDLLR